MNTSIAPLAVAGCRSACRTARGADRAGSPAHGSKITTTKTA
jgi:hypothetical protein